MSESRPDGSPRIALVTGASRGIGRAAALALARSGAHVVALARTQGGLEELDDEIRALRPAEPEATTLVPMDLRDFAAIDRLGEALHRRWGRLDAFVGNAGVLGLLTPLHQLDPKTWDEVMAVNVTANWRLIRSLDPLFLHHWQKDGINMSAFLTEAHGKVVNFPVSPGVGDAITQVFTDLGPAWLGTESVGSALQKSETDANYVLRTS